MSALYVINTLDNRRVSPEGFETRKAAKLVRNKLIAEGTICVISRGPDHSRGSSMVDQKCQNKERTTRRRSKVKQYSGE